MPPDRIADGPAGRGPTYPVGLPTVHLVLTGLLPGGQDGPTDMSVRSADSSSSPDRTADGPAGRTDISGRSADSSSSPDRTADGPTGRNYISGRSADSPSSSLTVEIASLFGRSIDFFGRLTGAIRPDCHLFICHVSCRGCYSDI